MFGLYKMFGLSAGAFSLTARGSLADVVLWAIARVQTRVFASKTYTLAMRVVAEEQAIEAVAVAQKAEADQQAQAEAALEHSQLRHERALRVARLKVGGLLILFLTYLSSVFSCSHRCYAFASAAAYTICCA